MTAEQVVDALEGLGCTVMVYGERVRVRGPKEAERLIPALRELKTHVLELLRQRAAPTDVCHVHDDAEFWERPEGGRVCGECHPDPQLPDPRRIPSPPEMPPGVKLVNWNPKPGPVAITCSSVVNDVPRFIRYTLEQLTAALDDQSRSWHARAWSPRDLVERLEQVGVVVELESNKEAWG